eukprot:TRINITY_DN4261_c1_g1_i1.p2 TRINITY_DN4261_c1_g1~~TRINITY_DN4261_c1_g1_i1.p2  ORF type:complete len:186 (+),score=9.63 TRINITY_DN4261_c1_g1_i1:115-672(+)
MAVDGSSTVDAAAAARTGTQAARRGSGRRETRRHLSVRRARPRAAARRGTGPPPRMVGRGRPPPPPHRDRGPTTARVGPPQPHGEHNADTQRLPIHTGHAHARGGAPPNQRLDRRRAGRLAPETAHARARRQAARGGFPPPHISTGSPVTSHHSTDARFRADGRRVNDPPPSLQAFATTLARGGR